MGAPHGSHYTMFSGFFKKASVTCLIVPHVLRTSRALVLHVFFAFCFLMLFVSRAVRAFLLLIPHLLQVFQAEQTHMHLVSRNFLVLLLLRFWCLSYVSFLQPGLRLIISPIHIEDQLNFKSITCLTVNALDKQNFCFLLCHSEFGEVICQI